jgi:hypothetical protein
MSSHYLLLSGTLVACLLVGCGVFVALILRRQRLQKRDDGFRERWKILEHMCLKSAEWPQLIIEADAMLDEALKQARFKGRTMGERLVAAQRRLSDNDKVWFGHKLKNKIAHQEITRLYKKDVQSALMGFRTALHDLGRLS